MADDVRGFDDHRTRLENVMAKSNAEAGIMTVGIIMLLLRGVQLSQGVYHDEMLLKNTAAFLWTTVDKYILDEPSTIELVQTWTEDDHRVSPGVSDCGVVDSTHVDGGAVCSTRLRCYAWSRIINTVGREERVRGARIAI